MGASAIHKCDETGTLLQNIVSDKEAMADISISRDRGECWPAAIVMLHRDHYSPLRCELPTDLTSLIVNNNASNEFFTRLYVVFDPAIP